MPKLMSKPRTYFKLEVSVEAKEQFQHLCDAHHITQQDAASMLFEWFCQADDTLQHHILHGLPKSVEKQALQAFCRKVMGKKG